MAALGTPGSRPRRDSALSARRARGLVAAQRIPAGTPLRDEDVEWKGTPAADVRPDEHPPLGVNQRVEHPIFGAGRIMEVVGAGEATKVTIHFDRAGRKVIKLKYAQLRLVE